MKKLEIIVLCVLSQNVLALNPRRVFKRKCLKCHTIGQGSKKGPDLKGLMSKYKTNWLAKYLKLGKIKVIKNKETQLKTHPIDLSYFDDADLVTVIEYVKAKGAGSKQNIESGIGNIKAGRILATNCTTCHGIKGISGDISIPNIAGQHRQYLIKQLMSFKNRYREDPKGNMNDVTQKLTKRDLVNIATYYSSLQP